MEARYGQLRCSFLIFQPSRCNFDFKITIDANEIVKGMLNQSPAAITRQVPALTKPKMHFTIYGIKNCDTMKKARTWLDNKGIAYDLP